MQPTDFGVTSLDVLRPEDIDWIELSPGSLVKPLRVSRRGGYVLLAKMLEGAEEPRHRHVGTINMFVISGEGTNINGAVAAPGSWIYEHDGAIHDGFTCTSETVALTISSGGGIELLDESDNVLAAVGAAQILAFLPEDVRTLVERD